MGIEAPTHKTNQATIKRNSEAPDPTETVKEMKVKKQLIEKGADPRLVRKAKGYWDADQAIKTYDEIHKND